MNFDPVWGCGENSGSPCYKCRDRHMGCHGSCLKYAGYHESRIKNSQQRQLNVIVIGVEKDLMKGRRGFKRK